jgi:MFS family permease
MLDAFDVMLYSMVIAALMADLGITKGEAGLLGSLTLLASAGGGMIFGIVADRAGRTRALITVVRSPTASKPSIGRAFAASRIALTDAGSS